ncbi:uncharacterized protein BJX67DRAFT_40701 [Aspergillus lucknowensis]|uniref:Uncharacterized protein n=1 Tax=Aspergillus lucknowensis TaxID=176173 RepID=A0ABR4LWJ7_9EURO
MNDLEDGNAPQPREKEPPATNTSEDDDEDKEAPNPAPDDNTTKEHIGQGSRDTADEGKTTDSGRASLQTSGGDALPATTVDTTISGGNEISNDKALIQTDEDSHNANGKEESSEPNTTEDKDEDTPNPAPADNTAKANIGKPSYNAGNEEEPTYSGGASLQTSGEVALQATTEGIAISGANAIPDDEPPKQTDEASLKVEVEEDPSKTNTTEEASKENTDDPPQALHSMVSSVGTLRQHVTTLGSGSSVLRERYTALRSENANLKEENRALSEELDSLKREKQRLEFWIGSLQRKVQEEAEELVRINELLLLS